MAYTIELALRGRSLGAYSQRAACSVVRDGKLIACAWAGKTEKKCLIEAILDEVNGNLEGACVYLSQELNTDETEQPPDYARRLVESKAIRVVVGAKAFNPNISNRAIQYMLEQGLEVEVGVLEREVKNLNRGLQKRYRQNMPWVCGLRCVDFDNRDQQIDFEDIILKVTVEKTRSDYDATVVVLPSSLGYSFKEPPPVIPSEQGDGVLVIVDLGEEVGNIERHLREKFYKIIVYSNKVAEIPSPRTDAELILLPLCDGDVDWPVLLRDLCDRGLNELIVGVNAEHHQTLMSHNLLDEFCLFLSPRTSDEHKSLSIIKSEIIGNSWVKINGRL